jgi:hypothetical protein
VFGAAAAGAGFNAGKFCVCFYSAKAPKGSYLDRTSNYFDLSCKTVDFSEFRALNSKDAY